MKIFYCFFLIVISFIECSDKKEAELFQNTYNLEKPNKIIKLSHALVEISGLSITDDPNTILAVNDEKGNIYKIERKTGEILDKYDFEKKGDYEGIIQVGHKVYVSNNKGDLFAYNLNKNKHDSKKYKTHLSSKNDVEGLTYDFRNNYLLLACKGDSGVDSLVSKSIYRFDLDKKELEAKPYYSILQKDMIKYVTKKSKNDKFILFNAKLRLLKDRVRQFAPSGITIHPVTNAIYILSSRGKMIVALDPKGNLDEIHFLNDQLFMQPEGICIDKDLTLYISTEGKQKKSRLFEFKAVEN